MNPSSQDPQLAREIGLREATALNMIDMIGVGPFVTIPVIISAMGGPQAMLGWILGAFFAVCDGLVWAELGASMPQAGGSIKLRAIRKHSGSINGAAIAIAVSPAADRIEILQRKTHRVHTLMARGAHWIRPMLLHLLAQRNRGPDLCDIEVRNAGRRWRTRERAAVVFGRAAARPAGTLAVGDQLRLHAGVAPAAHPSRVGLSIAAVISGGALHGASFEENNRFFEWASRRSLRGHWLYGWLARAGYSPP